MEGTIAAVKPSIMLILLALPLLYGIYLKSAKKLTAEKLCALLLISGLILRLCYISYTDEFTRQHDLGRFYEPNEDHSGYILYLMKNHCLPDFDPRGHWQFYHPPLHHIISAVVLSIVKALGIDYIDKGPGILQLISVGYSTLFAVLASKAVRQLGVKDNALVLSTAVVAFHPTLVILSGSINNDMLSALMQMAALYFTIRWGKERKLWQIICIAFSVGLGMMTKLTVGLLAPAIASVFLVILIKNYKEWKKLLPQFAAFGVICVPLGLFWPVRNLVKFGVPLNYVPALSPYSMQYIDVPKAQRLFDFSVYQLASPFTQWKWNGANYNEFNPVIALLKNSMFDEETFFPRSITLQSVCTLLFAAGAVCAVLSAVSVIALWRKKEKLPLEFKLLLTLTFGVIFVNYIIFCLNYPHVCTENMRYCVPLIFAGAASLGLMLDRTRDSAGTAAKLVSKTARFSMTAMPILSAFVYTVMMYYELTE